MKYNTVDKDITKKFLTILNRLKRTSSTYRKNRECQKEIFIRRTLNKNLSGKYFVFVNNEGTGLYTYDNPLLFESEREIKIPRKRYVHVNRVHYHLGYGEDLDVCVFFAHSANPNVELKFSIKDFLKLEFKEISEEEFSKVASMFLVDKEELNEKK